MALVVLDAGHGGSDPGAVNGNRYEKTDNLRLTLAVGSLLQACGINVRYTRDSDVYVSLIERSNISNTSGANLFVSLHRNSNINPSANGFEVHVYTNPTQASLNLASNIHQRVVDVGVQSDKGIQYSNFSVLRNTVAPAVLVETNFISNELDNQIFDSNFDQYAQAIASGIAATLGIDCGYDSNGNGGGISIPPEFPAPPAGGSVITQIQQTLNQKYNAGLVVDGLWGPVSQRALTRALQVELNNSYHANLVVDGIFGPRTKAAIPLVRLGNRGNLVYLLQAAMYVKGFRTTPDGIFGSNTQTTLRQFQASANLSQDGIAGPNTFAALFS
jgi:N-acetylmuramoyl-L-alanine amidase